MLDKSVAGLVTLLLGVPEFGHGTHAGRHECCRREFHPFGRDDLLPEVPGPGAGRQIAGIGRRLGEQRGIIAVFVLGFSESDFPFRGFGCHPTQLVVHTVETLHLPAALAHSGIGKFIEKILQVFPPA